MLGRPFSDGVIWKNDGFLRKSESFTLYRLIIFAKNRNNSILASPSPRHCRFPTENGTSSSIFFSFPSSKNLSGLNAYGSGNTFSSSITDDIWAITPVPFGILCPAMTVSSVVLWNRLSGSMLAQRCDSCKKDTECVFCRTSNSHWWTRSSKASCSYQPWWSIDDSQSLYPFPRVSSLELSDGATCKQPPTTKWYLSLRDPPSIGPDTYSTVVGHWTSRSLPRLLVSSALSNKPQRNPNSPHCHSWFSLCVLQSSDWKIRRTPFWILRYWKRIDWTQHNFNSQFIDRWSWHDLAQKRYKCLNDNLHRLEPFFLRFYQILQSRQLRLLLLLKSIPKDQLIYHIRHRHLHDFRDVLLIALIFVKLFEHLLHFYQYSLLHQVLSQSKVPKVCEHKASVSLPEQSVRLDHPVTSSPELLLDTQRFLVCKHVAVPNERLLDTSIRSYHHVRVRCCKCVGITVKRRVSWWSSANSFLFIPFF